MPFTLFVMLTKRIVAHDAHFNQPCRAQTDYQIESLLFKNSTWQTSAMRNVHILCLSCPPPGTTYIRLRNFRGEGPPKLDAEIFIQLPSRNVCKLPRRYKLKYTRFLASFRIWGVENCWGQTHPCWASFNIVKFLGGNALTPWDMSVRKSWFWVGGKNGAIFAVCGPKFTKFGRRVREWSQFATPFSSRRYLVPIWRCLQ